MKNRAKIYELNGEVAIRLGEANTQYLSTDFVKILAKELKLAHSQIANGYHYPSTTIDMDGK